MTTGPAPSRAEGVVLLGEMTGSGYLLPPALARRADGQTIQLTPLLYALLEALDGDRDAEALAQHLRVRTGRPVSAENVETLLSRLRELGLAARADGSQPEVRRSDPLLGLRFRVSVTNPERTRRITAPFARLFHPLIAVPVLLCFAAVAWWVLVHEGLAAATHQAFAEPGLLLAVLAVTVLSGGFHEFGHAAAARRGGAQPGVMGAGLYLVWPAFYTDVTDSYRLGRAGRLRTDLGGLYFNAIVVVATFAAWWLTGWHAVLLIVATQLLQMLRQLLPLVRFDGYHVLADLTGVPDLFQRIGPTLRALLPWRPTEPGARALKPWARTVVTAWVLVVVPVLLAAVVLLVLALPRVVGTALAAADGQRRSMGAALDQGDLISVAAHGLAALVVLLPVAAIGILLVRLARSGGRAVWRRTTGRPGRRALAVTTALAGVAGLAWAWWPTDERYRPVEAWEGGTIGDAVLRARPAFDDVTVGSRGAGTVYLPEGAAPPTRERPQLAVVLVPTDADDADLTERRSDQAPAPADGTTTASGDEIEPADVAPAEEEPWVFPFDEPLAPGPEDNQALAVNTTDGTVTYDVAFALIWADGDEPVTTTNEAFAAASCEGCTAVAVAFQVVLVTGQTDVAVPANLSVAVNHECSSCLTYALAVQLFITLDGPLSDQAVAAVDRLWQEILAFGTAIGSTPLSQIQDRLTAYEQQIIDILEADQGPLPSLEKPTGTASPTAAGDSSPVEPTRAPSSTPTGTGTPDPTPTTTARSPSPTRTTSSASASPTDGPTSGTGSSPTGTSTSSSEPTSASAPATASAQPTRDASSSSSP